ncbi:MAG: hypothetical protein AABY07_09300 [Nanoarchaeota archaeon]
MSNVQIHDEALSLLRIGSIITDNRLSLEEAVKLLNSRPNLTKDIANDGTTYYKSKCGAELIIDKRYGKVGVEVRHKWDTYTPRIKTDD